MSIICCAAAGSAVPACPLTGSATSPKCTAAVCASDNTNADEGDGGRVVTALRMRLVLVGHVSTCTISNGSMSP